MIKEIQLKNVATFAEKVELKNLKRINFFYGANGSGKTTISKVIANPDNYNNCELTWKNNNKVKSINGIYTMGEGASVKPTIEFWFQRF